MLVKFHKRSFTNHPNWVKSDINCNVLFLYEGSTDLWKLKAECLHEWEIGLKKTEMTREPSMAQEKPLHLNKTIMCHIIINKTPASSSTLKVTTDVHRVISIDLLLLVWFSHWCKPWRNYCTFVLNSFISIFKDCQHHESMCITIELWSSIEKLSKGITLFSIVFIFFSFWFFRYSFTVKPQNRSTFFWQKPPAFSNVHLVGGWKCGCSFLAK